MAIKQCLKRGRKGTPEAMTGLDLAINSLFRLDGVFKVSKKLYMRRLEGTLKGSDEEKIRLLGVKL